MVRTMTSVYLAVRCMVLTARDSWCLVVLHAGARLLCVVCSVSLHWRQTLGTYRQLDHHVITVSSCLCPLTWQFSDDISLSFSGRI